MNLVLSVPSGFHARELLLPIKQFIENDSEVQKITVISPGASHRNLIFKNYNDKFDFIVNPKSEEDHEKLLQSISPNLVITTTAGLDQKDPAILKAAKKLNINTFTFIASWDNVWKMVRARKKGNPIILADHIVVWNQMMHDHLLKAFSEITSKQVTILGAPRLDHLLHGDKIPSQTELRNYIGIPDDTKKLVHIATVELYPMEYIVKPIAEAFGDIAHLYASVHPGGNMDNHKQYAEKYNVTVKFSFGRQEKSPVPEFSYNPTQEDMCMLAAVFKHADILVNQSSTVAIESFVFNTPVVNVRYGAKGDWWNWYRSEIRRDFQEHYKDIISDGATKVVKNNQQLVDAVTNYLNSPSDDEAARKTTLKKMITTTDGTASQKMWDLIKKQARINK